MPLRAVLALALAVLVLPTACSGSEPSSGRTRADPGTEGSTGGQEGSTAQGGDGDRSGRMERTVEAIRDGAPVFVVVSRSRYMPTWEELGPEDPDYVFDTRNTDGGPSPMLVADAKLDDEQRAWFEVYLPIRPNGSTGWVSEEDVRLQEREERIEVDLSERTLERYRGDELVGRFKVGIGTDRYPTATGTFYVWARVPFENPNQPYGVFALGLSGFSPVLLDWPGEGRMAIHGTSHAGDRGQAVGHGCVRVYNPDMEKLVDVPLGTPVLITR